MHGGIYRCTGIYFFKSASNNQIIHPQGLSLRLQSPAQVSLRNRVPDLQAWLPLGSQENALEEMGRLSERSELRPIFSALSIFLQA